MESRKLILAGLFLLLLISGCGKSDNKTAENKANEQKKETTSSGQNQNSNEEFVEIKLPTMQCGTCKKTIEAAVKKIDGIKDVNVVVKEKIAKVNFDKSKTDLDKIEGVIVMAGYQANDKPADEKAYDKLEACCKIGGHK